MDRRNEAETAKPAPGPGRPPRRRAVALAVGLAVAFGLAEAGLRILCAVRGKYDFPADTAAARRDGPWIASDDPELVYVHRPSLEAEGEMKIESHGILRPVHVGPKPAGGKRVLVVGDSVGAALWLRHGERFPTQIERALSSPGGAGPVEVLNLCVNGYDTLQEARLLETLGTSLGPDAVVLQYCLNDPGTSVQPRAWFEEPDPPVSFAVDEVVTGVRRLLGSPRGRPLAPGAGPRSVAAPSWEWMYDPGGDPWRSVLDGFDRCAAWSRARGVPVLVAVVPLLVEDDPQGATTATFRQLVVEAARARGLDVVDLQDEVASHPAAALRHRAEDIYHFDARGQEVLAAALVPLVRGLLTRGPRAAGADTPR